MLKALLLAYWVSTPAPALAPPPVASVDELTWLSGYWRGEGLGGRCEEIWSAPMAGTMMGTFRLVKDDAVAFYELMILTHVEGRLVLKLKHFDSDLVGWEEKEGTVSFELERLEPNRAFFKGLSMERDGDRLEIRVRIKYESGEVKDEPFVFERYDPALTRETKNEK